MINCRQFFFKNNWYLRARVSKNSTNFDSTNSQFWSRFWSHSCFFSFDEGSGSKLDVGEAAVASDGEEGESIKINVDIPEELKFVLVSDWDLLTHKKSIFSLPGIPAILAQIDRRKKNRAQNCLLSTKNRRKDFFRFLRIIVNTAKKTLYIRFHFVVRLLHSLSPHNAL